MVHHLKFVCASCPDAHVTDKFGAALARGQLRVFFVWLESGSGVTREIAELAMPLGRACTEFTVSNTIRYTCVILSVI